MGEPFIGEIRMFGGNFAPAGWAFCQGQLMAISENDALFTLIGTTYGGDGQETFGMPDLQGRIPIHSGTGSDGITYQLGEKTGVETVTLTVQQTPTHTHPLLGSTSTASSTDTAGNVGARVTVAAVFPYGTDAPLQPLSPQAVAPVGGSQPHDNLQPYLCISFIISLFGVFPSQN
jgi:microcystin-dependent protein